MTGKVFLLGAGPGDGGLLTRKGERVLRGAQVVVYDRLVGDDILAMMPESAELINVGKHAGSHPVPQEQISRILLDKALEGKNVVRLKGGDCFLFGRGGEELELLCEHHVPFEVIPGVPSPIAATAYAGIPVTHRDFCASVHFITGHRRENGALDLDYETLVKLNGTLVFLMSVATCGEIASGLIAGGMSPEMDCAVIENGTRPNQRRFLSTLDRLERTVEENRVVSPALIVVGRVCSLADSFDWFDTLPLHGKKLLVTSRAGTASRLEEKLREQGAMVTVLPAIETVPISFPLPDLAGVKLAAFTSVFGVEACFRRLDELGLDARWFGGVKLAAIGSGTAEALRARGLRADCVPARYDGEALANALLDSGLLRSGDAALLLRAEEGGRELPDILVSGGVSVRETAVYSTRPLPLGGVDPASFDWVLLTSASGVRSFASSCRESGFTDFSHVSALCIGPKTARAAEELGLNVNVSAEATLDSMIKYLQEA